MADKNQDLQADIKELKNIVQQQAARIQELESKGETAAPQRAAKVAPPKETFTVGDKKFRFVVGQYIDGTGNRVKAADALKNVAELERLVAIQSGVVQLAK